MEESVKVSGINVKSVKAIYFSLFSVHTQSTILQSGEMNSLNKLKW